MHIAGPAGLIADLGAAFAGIDGLLLIVALSAVLLNLLVVYRAVAPPFVVLFTSISALTLAGGIVYLLARNDVLTLNGQSQGIPFILVVGATTDYGLLLVSRYREELRRHEDKHEAMRVALRSAGPAILASGLTVIAALLTLTLAEVNSTAGLGPVGAVGIGLAMISMLTTLPALLTICGRNAFWSPGLDTIPHTGQAGVDETHGFWRRIGERVATRPRAIWIGGSVVLVILAANLVGLDLSQTQGTGFRGQVDSVDGQAILARNFAAGASAPTDLVVTDPSRAEQVAQQAKQFGDVRPGTSDDTAAQLALTLKSAPYSSEALDAIPKIREALGDGVLVGGPTAQEYDLHEAAARDNKLIIPLTLLVVFVILIGLLRAVVAPLLLIISVILSFAAALGVGVFVSEYIFGFTGMSPTLPLLCFVFLVALGIDYNIFLMARVREESIKHGTREGTLRGLAVTGAVISGAGIVLAGTFGALAVLPLVVLTQIGFIVAFGVLLDTFFVRSVIVPAAVIDVGRRVWLPSKLAKESRDSARAPTA